MTTQELQHELEEKCRSLAALHLCGYISDSCYTATLARLREEYTFAISVIADIANLPTARERLKERKPQ